MKSKGQYLNNVLSSFSPLALNKILFILKRSIHVKTSIVAHLLSKIPCLFKDPIKFTMKSSVFGHGSLALLAGTALAAPTVFAPPPGGFENVKYPPGTGANLPSYPAGTGENLPSYPPGTGAGACPGQSVSSMSSTRPLCRPPS